MRSCALTRDVICAVEREEGPAALHSPIGPGERLAAMEQEMQNQEVLTTILHGAGDRTQKAKRLAEAIRQDGNYRWVGLYDVDDVEVSAIAWTGDFPPAYPSFPVTKGLTGAAIDAREPVIVQDVSKDPRYLTTFDSSGSEAIFPILSRDGSKVIGTIDIESDRCNAFSKADTEMLLRIREVVGEFWHGLSKEAPGTLPKPDL